jgi:transcriptional regulator with XRE-family HTH domain
MSAAFPQKLRLVLKLLSMSGAQLSQQLGVDKSVTSRWLSGAVAPSSHNMARLSALMAEHAPGFRMIDWDRDLASLADLFGAEAEGLPPGRASHAAPGLSLVIGEQAVLTTTTRGRAYEGFYRLVRPVADPEPGFAYDYSMVRVEANGLLGMKLASFGAIAQGWVLPLHNQLYVLLSDRNNGGMTFAILNGMATTKVDAVDGIALGSALDAGRTPTAIAIYCERVGDLSGDPAADEAFFAGLAQKSPQAAPGEVSPELAAHLLPEFGPDAEGRGGKRLMQVGRATSWARGASPMDQIAAGISRPAPAAAAEIAPPGDSFAGKLRLVLKVLTLSGAQLAAALEIHKSVVSRWLSGGVEPSAHNLGRLSALIATRVPGFTMLDWDRSPESLAELLGADLASIPALRNAVEGLMTFNLWDQITATAALRGRAYEGFFRVTRPAIQAPGRFVREYGLIEPHPSGIPRFRMATFGAMLDGWMLPLHDQLYFVAADTISGALMFAIFNGVGADRVDAVDGISLSPSLDVSRSPTAMPLLSEHFEERTGDPAADEARLQELAAIPPLVADEEIPLAVRTRLTRSGGQSVAAAGGNPILQMPLEGSLSRARRMMAV